MGKTAFYFINIYLAAARSELPEGYPLPYVDLSQEAQGFLVVAGGGELP